jgi:hypothetical protein
VYLLGGFRYPGRVQLYAQLRAGEDVSAESTPALDLLEHLGVSQGSRSTISKLSRPDPTWDQPRGDAIIAIHLDGHAEVLGDISEVQSWAEQEPRLYLWLSFTLVALGVGIDIILKLVPPSDPPSILETQVFS